MFAGLPPLAAPVGRTAHVVRVWSRQGAGGTQVGGGGTCAASVDTKVASTLTLHARTPVPCQRRCMWASTRGNSECAPVVHGDVHGVVGSGSPQPQHARTVHRLRCIHGLSWRGPNECLPAGVEGRRHALTQHRARKAGLALSVAGVVHFHHGGERSERILQPDERGSALVHALLHARHPPHRYVALSLAPPRIADGVAGGKGGGTAAGVCMNASGWSGCTKGAGLQPHCAPLLAWLGGGRVCGETAALRHTRDAERRMHGGQTLGRRAAPTTDRAGCGIAICWMLGGLCTRRAGATVGEPYIAGDRGSLCYHPGGAVDSPQPVTCQLADARVRSLHHSPHADTRNWDMRSHVASLVFASHDPPNPDNLS